MLRAGLDEAPGLDREAPMPGRVTPEEARAHLEAARRDPIMRAIRERDPRPR
jgi:hypothetical protein